MTALDEAIQAYLNKTCLSPHQCHEFVKQTYNWLDIARRTEKVYDIVHNMPITSIGDLFLKYQINSLIYL